MPGRESPELIRLRLPRYDNASSSTLGVAKYGPGILDDLQLSDRGRRVRHFCHADFRKISNAAHEIKAFASPGEIAARVLEGIASGTEDILADERSRTVFAELRKDDRAFDANMQRIWDSRQDSH